MLILIRNSGQTIYIGEDVKVTVPGVQGNQARIGIMAPGDLSIDREEIYKRIQDEGNNAN